MNTIYVTTGEATGPTEIASYDAALADANLHNYNLVPVSSIVPEDARVERVDAVPDLGPAGDRVFVVQARATSADAGPLAAGLGWATGPGPGLLYEATGRDADAVADEIDRGLDAGTDLRDWSFDDRSVVVDSIDDTGDADEYATVVVVAAFDSSSPMF